MKKIKLLLLIGLVITAWLSLSLQPAVAANDVKSCKKCHQDVKKTWEKSVHKKMGINCLSCHKENMKLRKSKKELCVMCHTTREVKAGKSVGMPQKEVFEGVDNFWTNGKMSNFHIRSDESCVGCHMPQNKNHTFEIIMPEIKDGNKEKETKESKEQVDSCTSCHTIIPPELLRRKIDKWQRKTENSLKEVKKLLEKKKQFKDREIYQKAKTNYLLVKNDGSKGVHNYLYVKGLLGAAINNLKELN